MAARSRAQRLIDLFTPATTDLAIGRSGTAYHLDLGLGSGRYWQQFLTQVAGTTGGYLLNQLNFGNIAVPMLSTDEVDPAVVYAGTWAAGQTNVGAYPTTGRTFTDGATTNGSATLTSAAGAQFTAADIGLGVNGTGIPVGTRITAVASLTSATMSANATATNAGTLSVTIGRSYTRSNTAASTATWTTPASVTKVGFHVVATTNGGLGKVSIDGSSTAASLLPTAQDVVDAGTYANTILVANGGTLNPTDRVLDCYAATPNFDTVVAAADNLSAAAHTVVVTVTGYKPAASSDTRVYLAGFTYATASTRITTAATTLMTASNVNRVASAWEYAIDTLPAGGTTSTFLGNIHGYDVQDSLAIKVDGVTTTLTDGQVVAATSSIDVTRTSHLVHPDTAATVVANCVVVYHLDRYGLRVDVTITWQVAATIQAAYTMMPMNGMSLSGGAKFTKGNTSGWSPSSGPQSFPGSSDTYYAKAKGAAAWMWDARSSGLYGALMWMPDVVTYTNGWAKSSPAFMQVEDRNGTLSKIYCTRVAGSTAQTEAVTAGQVWTSSTRHLVGYFPAGADTVLAAA